jgi:hypothetical protein
LTFCSPTFGQQEPDTAGERVIHPDLATAEQEKAVEPDPYRIWASADWWLAWIKGAAFPILVTQGASSDSVPGALGQQGTMLRFGGGEVVPHDRQGARFEVGGWLDSEEFFGAVLSGAFLASRNVGTELASPGTPVLARPFLNVATQQQDASLVTFPGLASGTISVESGTRLWGADANLLATLIGSPDYSVRLLCGLRYFELHDDLTVTENVQVNATSPLLAGQQVVVCDNFACDNSFYGGNIGFRAAYTVRQLELQVTGQCGLGLCQELVGVAGLTDTNWKPGRQTIPAGLLAVSSNSGDHVRNVFAVVPEVDVNARYEITRHLIVSAGYSFMYWSQVARAAQQVNTNVNPNLVPTSVTFGQPTTLQQPQLLIRDTDFWVQGVHLGVELRF